MSMIVRYDGHTTIVCDKDILGLSKYPVMNTILIM